MAINASTESKTESKKDTGETMKIVTLTINPAIDKSAGVSKVVPDRKLYCGLPRHEPGGGGVNVSRAIRRLGGESLAIYTAGGTTGQMLQELIQKEGLVQHVIPITGLTRENLIIFEESTGQQFRFDMPGQNLNQSEWQQCLDALSEVKPAPDFIVASGSLPPGVPDDFYARVARVARKIGTKAVIDAPGAALRRALEESVYMIKPNMREFQEISGKQINGDQELRIEARHIVDKGQSEIVVVSLGVGGVLGVWQGGSEKIQSPTVPIISRVGAGDSTVAGIVLSLSRDQSIENALRFGVAAGAAAVMNPATELCRREDTERLYQQLVSSKTD